MTSEEIYRRSVNLFRNENIKSGRHYTKTKVDEIVGKLQEIWGEKHSINYYVRRFMPGGEFIYENRGKHKGTYLFVREG